MATPFHGIHGLRDLLLLAPLLVEVVIGVVVTYVRAATRRR